MLSIFVLMQEGIYTLSFLHCQPSFFLFLLIRMLVSLKAVLNIALLTWRIKFTSDILVLDMNKAGPSGCANQKFQRCAGVHPFFCCYSYKWDQMGPTIFADAHSDSVETLISSSVSDAFSFSTFCTSVESLLNNGGWPCFDVKYWLTSRMGKVANFVHFT